MKNPFDKVIDRYRSGLVGDCEGGQDGIPAFVPSKRVIAVRLTDGLGALLKFIQFRV